jgi:hypothetical protein
MSHIRMQMSVGCHDMHSSQKIKTRNVRDQDGQIPISWRRLWIFFFDFGNVGHPFSLKCSKSGKQIGTAGCNRSPRWPPDWLFELKVVGLKERLPRVERIWLENQTERKLMTGIVIG